MLLFSLVLFTNRKFLDKKLAENENENRIEFLSDNSNADNSDKLLAWLAFEVSHC